MVNKIPLRSSELCEWGGTSLPYVYIAQRTAPQNANAIRQGPEGQRADQQGAIKMKISDLSGGLFKRVGDWTRDGNRYAYNEGLMTHIPGGLYLPYFLTTQTSITSEADISGYRAANKRVRALNTALGTNALRYFLAAGTKLYSDTSISNPALVVLATLTNNICSMCVGKWNNTAYLALGTDGTTDDILGIADPIDSPGTTTTLVALSANDVIEAMANFPTVGDGYMLYYGKYGGSTTGLWYTAHSASVPATPVQCVNAATYSVDGALATVTVTASPTQARTDTSVGDVQWTNIANIFSSDNSRATVDFTGAGQTSGRLIAGGFDFSSIPSSATITGMQVSIEKSEQDTASNVTDLEVNILVGNSAVSINKADTTTEWSTTDATVTYGSTTDLWSYNFTVASLRTLEVMFRVSGEDGNFPDARVDYISVAVTYRLPGTGISLPLGGWSPGPLASNPNRWPLILPTVDEQNTVLVPRELWWADVTFDSQGERPIVALSKVNTGLTHIEACVAYSGGLAVAGDSTSGVGKAVKLIDSNGQVRDLGFLGQDGFESGVGVVNMFAAGRVLICEVAWEDASNAQWWYYFDGTWHASTPLQTKSAAIAALPLAWAEAAINVNQQIRYRIYPSTTHTAAARMFQPRNIFEDPLVNNATQPKQDGPLYVRLPELNMGGPEEANKSMLYIDYLGRLASDTSGAYGTVLMELDTGGDTAFTSVEVSNSFNGAFESYPVPTSGVAFRTVIPRITLDNARSASSKTPNGLPFLFTMAVEWPLLSVWDVYLDVKRINGMYDHITNFFNTLVSTSNTKVTQQFRWGVVDSPAVFEGMDVKILPVPVNGIPTEIDGIPFVSFREVRGTTA